ncbi:MAG: DUF4105 domain-containing protein [Spirochaetes bacterium]|nr:DUF4105 domain-containing protein [Spirochaetota bacterium]
MGKRCERIKALASFFILCVIILCVILLTTQSALSIPDEQKYVQLLIDRANRLSLHAHDGWRALVHYKETFWGTQSLIDDPKFFLSPDGKTNPQAELHATIRAFFSQPKSGEKHPVCRFIARYHWLKEMLTIDETKIPMKGCNEIEQFIDKIAPKTATLVFPASNINSPASMFGHTLLSIETANRSKLLAHAIDYSAHTQESWMVMLAAKGIFGFYNGYFNILPYYAKVQEYNDFDKRDIWEYRLTFTEQEVRTMIYHILELENIYSHYYFFDENCSYNILFLLDVARPSLKLTDRFYTKIPTWVIPVDTIRAIKDAGLIEAIDFRPSRVTKIRSLAKKLSPEGEKLAVGVIQKKIAPKEIQSARVSHKEKAYIADLLTEYIRYQYADEKISKEEYSTRFIDILNVRSALNGPNEELFTTTSATPESGHRSARAFFGTGSMGKSLYQEFRIRPAYHTILDPDDGYIEGGQIVFSDISVRYYDFEKKFSVQRWEIINLFSLTPNDAFIRAVSWKVNTGLRRVFALDDHTPLVAFMNPGRGFAWDTPVGILYTLGEMDFGFGKNIENHYFIAGGISCGMLVKVARVAKLHLHARDLFHAFPSQSHEGTLHCTVGIALFTNMSMILETKFELAASPLFDRAKENADVLLGINAYF